MKIKQIITPLLILCAVLVGCTAKAALPTDIKDNKEMKSIIVYFTHSNNTGLAAQNWQRSRVLILSDSNLLNPTQPKTSTGQTNNRVALRSTSIRHVDRL